MKKTKSWRRLVPCGLAAFSFGVMAQEPPASTLGPKWGPHIDAEAKFGTLRNLGEADLFVPVMQNEDTLLFGDLRARLDDHSSNEGNFGLGMRHMLPSGWNLGVYGYYDRRYSPLGNIFRQWTLGGEMLGRDWELRANDYIPTGTRSYDVNSLNTAILSGTAVTFIGGAENSMAGYDAEVGWRVPLFAVEDPSQLRLYLGGYRFTAVDTPTVSGPRARAQLALAQVPWLWQGAQLFVDAESQHDSPRGSQQFLGFRLRIPLGATAQAQSHLNWQERRMIAPIVRDVDVVTEAGAFGARETVTETANGSAITVLSSNTTTGANLPAAVAAAGANSTVILSGTFNTTANTVMQSGQTLIGGGSLSVKAPSGRTASLMLPGATIAANGGFVNAVSMANNATLSGMTITNPYSAASGNGVSAQGMTGVTISNNTITVGGASGGYAIDLNAATNAIVSGNTITATSSSALSAIGIRAVAAGNSTIANNTFSMTGTTRYVIAGDNTSSFAAGSTGNTTNGGVCFFTAAPTGSVGFSTITCP